VGAGVYHNGPAPATATESAYIPPYTIVDAFAGYRLNSHWRAQLNVNNLLNLNYLALAIQTTQAMAGNPRDFSGELEYSY
jgi:outer membrane receptor protein involved in Fe transport